MDRREELIDGIEPSLEVALQGGVRATVSGDAVPLRRKAAAMLAYLSVESKEVRRAHLASFLWDNSDEASARNSLRQTLFELRTTLRTRGCDALVVTRESVLLRAVSRSLDIESIVTSVKSGELGLEVARALSPGGIMAGVEDVSEHFHQWVAQVRERVRKDLLREFESVFTEELGTLEVRMRSAEAALGLDPFNEQACRYLMKAHAEKGEVGAAIKVYETLYHTLDVDLAMEPSAPTQELIARIKQGEVGGAGSYDTKSNIGTVELVSSVSFGGAPTLAVLPLRVLGPDDVPRFFAEGVVEDIVAMMSSLKQPIVIANRSVKNLQRGPHSFVEAAGTLQARYVVTGSVRQLGETTRLSLRLVEAASETILWAKNFDTDEPNLFETNDAIVEQIAFTLVPNLKRSELARTRRRRPEELSAFHLLLQAQDLAFNLDHTTFLKAGELISLATKKDPTYAPSYSALADWYSVRLGQGWSASPDSDLRLLEYAARRAISLDPASGRALAMFGHNRTILSRSYAESLALLARALEASPNDPETLMWATPTLAYYGESDRAVEHAKRAIALSPIDPYMFRYEHFLSIAEYAAGNYEAASHWGQSSFERNPRYVSNLRMTAASLAAEGQLASAREMGGRVLELQPDFSIDSIRDKQAFRHDEQRDSYFAHLTLAGLPS